MNSKLILGSIFILIIIGLDTSCTYYEIKPTKVPDSVRFTLNIQPIFTTKCVNCHKTGGQAPDLSVGKAYNSLLYGGYYIDTDIPEQSPLYIKITTGSMKDNATDTDRSLILKWIQQGALNN